MFSAAECDEIASLFASKIKIERTISSKKEGGGGGGSGDRTSSFKGGGGGGGDGGDGVDGDVVDEARLLKHTKFIFNCQIGKGRSTLVRVAANY
jgi:hypothetical protein